MFDFTALISDASHASPVLVAFHHSWCSHCCELKKLLEAAAERSGFIVMAIDIDEHDDLAAEHEAISAPDLRLWRHGREIGRFVDGRDLAMIEDLAREPQAASA